MSSSPRVSIVIPVYLRQRGVNFALQSLAAEAELIHEVVVVDDASPDPITIAPPTALADRTRLIRLPENLGSSAARQTAVNHATGDLIAFLDSDDVWLPGKLAAQLPYFRKGDPMVAVATGWQEVDLDRGVSSTRIPAASADPVDFASGCWFCPGSTVIVTRDALERCGPFDTGLRRLEDLDWFLRFALQRGRLVVAETVGAVIRRRGPRTNRAAVQDAAFRITKRFATHPAATSRIRRYLAAWLDVELASAAWLQGHRTTALALILRSQMHVPRRSIHIRCWWQTVQPILSDAEARALLGFG
jgi:glycosyltransferase involved in cell wall biosynthesis